MSFAQPPRGDWRRIKPTAGLRFDPSRAGQATLVDSMVTSRRKHKEPKKREEKTGPSIEMDPRRIWDTFDSQERFEWLENALLNAARREMEFSKIDEVIGNAKFAAGCSNKIRGKMKELLLANMHVFKKDQQKTLKGLAEVLGTPASGSGGDAENGDERRKRKKERREGRQDSRERDRDRRRKRDDQEEEDFRAEKKKKQKRRDENDDSPGRGRQREPSEEDNRKRRREPSEDMGDRQGRGRDDDAVWGYEKSEKSRKSGEKSEFLVQWEQKMLQNAREM